MTRLLGILLGVLVMLAAPAQAEEWPAKPIRMIVPFPAGGPTDFIARESAEILRRELKQPVVVENRAGGNGVLGLNVLAKAPADGYTIGLVSITLAIAPHLGRPLIHSRTLLRLPILPPRRRF
ncbi:hypothetical protein GFK26_21535 [Variovorax paradoxus]|uniref:Tripartite tricarboxylate transporter family receptor n=1 Tax=Variovorax paradoxus TaxID=34073 RepID=A0A5Q0M942_VARPD|nr:tripartite tricarboxylate transporter substrate-binding protein [Variovorax paradoxus]QFZ85154.1 hypothetical protein GFK26_21535 [Variovorax paradoxus]